MAKGKLPHILLELALENLMSDNVHKTTTIKHNCNTSTNY